MFMIYKIINNNINNNIKNYKHFAVRKKKKKESSTAV